MRNLPDFITFTGADDKTDIGGMLDLSRHYPIEWGILFSPKRQGEDPRYPGEDTVRRIVSAAVPVAAHLCGRHSGDVMKGNVPLLSQPLEMFGRIQVNSRKPRAERIAVFQRKMGIPCIAQARGEAFPEERNINWLFDTSGGRGEAPFVWPAYPGRMVGYAGGLGPETVLGALEAIDAQGSYWIDMESGVRTDDWFDLDLCEKVCRSVFGG